MSEGKLENYWASQARTVEQALPGGAVLLHDGPLLIVSVAPEFPVVAAAVWALTRARLQEAPLVQEVGGRVLLTALSAKGAPYGG